MVERRAPTTAKVAGMILAHKNDPNAHHTFTELDGSNKTTAATLGAGDGQWLSWDISGIIPVSTIEVLVGILKHTASDVCGVRKGGTSVIRTFSVAKDGSAFMPTLPSATRTLDIMSADVSDDDEFCIFGYRS